MTSNRALARLAPALALALFAAPSAGSGLLKEVRYLDPYGREKTAHPQDTPHINPAGRIDLIAAGGIGRRLEAAWVNAQGSAVASARTGPITDADRLALGEDVYFGHRWSLDTPSGDGEYTLAIRLLDTDHTVVAAESFPVTLDRTPPVLLGGFGWRGWSPRHLEPMPPDTLVGSTHATAHWVSRVVDAGSGLDPDSGRFQSLWLEGPTAGEVAYETRAGVDLEAGRLSIPQAAGGVRNGVHFPRENARFLARFVVSDRAGNTASFDQPLRWMGYCDPGDWQIVAVHDPAHFGNPIPGSPFSGFRPYAPGMRAETNPVRMVVRIPRAHWWSDSPFGVSLIHQRPGDPGGFQPTADYTDDHYVYEEISVSYVPAGTRLFHEYRFAAPVHYACDPGDTAILMPQLELSANARPTPVLERIELELREAGVVPATYRANRRDTLVRVSAFAEPRAYEQVFVVPPLDAQCVIAPAESRCDIRLERPLAPEPGDVERLHGNLYLHADDLISNGRSFDLQFDRAPPRIEDVVIAADGASATLTLSETCLGCWARQVGLKRVWVEASGASGVTRRDALPLHWSDHTSRAQARLPLGELPAGVYQLAFFAEDNHGNRSEPFRIARYRRGGEPPRITLSTAAGTALDGASLRALREILISVSSPGGGEAQVTTVRLAGGAHEHPVGLAFYRDGDGYRVEAPPTPDAGGGRYRLEVLARDAQGTQAQAEAQFLYQPEAFALAAGERAPIALPLAPLAVRRPDGEWPLTTTVAVVAAAGGVPLAGTSDLRLSLAAHARAALVVAGQTLRPGASLIHPRYDFTASGGRITLPLHIADPGATPPGVIGDLLIEILRPGAPALVASVAAWNPASALRLEQTQPAYARRVEAVALAVRADAAPFCATPLAREPAAEAADRQPPAEGTAVCGIRLQALPPGLAVAADDPTRIAGRVVSELPEEPLAYEPGLYVHGPRGWVFHATGPAHQHHLRLREADPPALTLALTLDPAGEPSQWLAGANLPAALLAAGQVEVHANSPYPGLVLRLTDDSSGTLLGERAFLGRAARIDLRPDPAAQRSPHQLRVAAGYLGEHAEATTGIFSVATDPRDPVLLLAVPGRVPDSTESILSGRFGRYAEGRIAFAPAQLGDWVIRLYREVSRPDGSFQPVQIGPDVTEIAQDGAFSVSLGGVPPGAHAIFAEARPTGTATANRRAITTPPARVRFADPSPIALTLEPVAEDVFAPSVLDLALRLEDPTRAADVGALTWERLTSADQYDAIGEPWWDGDRATLRVDLTAPGEHRLRLSRRERESAAAPTTQTLTVRLHERPTLVLTGAPETRLGEPVTWQVAPDPHGRPRLVRWVVYRPGDTSPLELVGEQHTLVADRPGLWHVTVSARFADAPDVPEAWSKAARGLRVPPPLPTARILGPEHPAPGTPLALRAEARIAGHPADALTVEGEWELPDGTRRLGPSLSYTCRAVEDAVAYRAWMQGHRGETEVSARYPCPMPAYDFPRLRLQRERLREYGPARYRYTLGESRQTPRGERPTLHWSLPPGVSVDVRSPTVVVLSVPQPGSYRVGLAASDTRGNQAQFEDQLVVADPPPVTVAVTVEIPDRHRRAPANVALAWEPAGLLPDEGVAAVRAFLDGILLPGAAHDVQTVEVRTPGRHKLEVQIETTYGRTARGSAHLHLVPTDRPGCGLVLSGDAVRALRAKAECWIGVGQVSRYRWWVTYRDTGETSELPARGPAIALSRDDLARGVAEVRVAGINDRGEEGAPTSKAP